MNFFADKNLMSLFSESIARFTLKSEHVDTETDARESTISRHFRKPACFKIYT
jgi:hypothetical protein